MSVFLHNNIIISINTIQPLYKGHLNSNVLYKEVLTFLESHLSKLLLILSLPPSLDIEVVTFLEGH